MRITTRVAAVSAVGCLLLVGCGGGANEQEEGPKGNTVAGDKLLELADSQMELLTEGTYELPALDPVDPPPGKDLWLVTVGLTAGASVNTADAFEEAGHALGWNVTVFDGKFSPQEWSSGIRSAVAAQADGIWMYSFDCTSVKAALAEAREADIPVVITQGEDCGSGGEALADVVTGYNVQYGDGVVQPGDGTLRDWASASGAAVAWWAVDQLGEEVAAIELVETDLTVTLEAAAGFESVLSQCEECEIVERVEFLGTDVGAPLQQKVEQALVQHPEANVVYANYDSTITSGVAAAVRASAQNDVFVLGMEGFAANMELVRSGEQAAGAGYESEWDSWGAIDAFARLFAGQEPLSNYGFGVKVFDAETNLPSEGEDFKSGLDYQSVFKEAWGIE